MWRNRDPVQMEHARAWKQTTPFRRSQAEQNPRLIAHGEGNYFTTPEELRRLEQNRQVIFRYTNAEGAATDEANPNGSIDSIAGICNDRRNIVGLMPHPERACEAALGSADGLVMFESVMAALTAGTAVLAPAGSATV
jgi:phosphoribosylformylglycinamidine synthase